MATYKVKAGDSWWKIANEQLGSGAKYAELAKFNNMDVSKTLYPGQTINLPASSAAANAASKTSTNTSANPSLARSSTARPTYKPGQSVTDAEQTLEDWNNQKPGDYQSQYEDKIDQILDDLLNGKTPVYDASTDPVYQQYKDNYIRQGQMAMMDTMANAAALSGGYGNSYASTVGNQAYQAYLSELNNILPELADAAYERYQTEQAGKRDNLSILQGLEESDYRKYQDLLDAWFTNRDYLAGRYDAAYQKDYGSYRDSVSDWEADRDYQFKQEQAKLEQQRWEQEYALSKAKAYASSGGGSSPKSSDTKDSNDSPASKELTAEQLKKLSSFRNVTDARLYLKGLGLGLNDDEIRSLLKAAGFSEDEIDTAERNTHTGGSGGPISSALFK